MLVKVFSAKGSHHLVFRDRYLSFWPVELKKLFFAAVVAVNACEMRHIAYTSAAVRSICTHPL